MIAEQFPVGHHRETRLFRSLVLRFLWSYGVHQLVNKHTNLFSQILISKKTQLTIIANNS